MSYREAADILENVANSSEALLTMVVPRSRSKIVQACRMAISLLRTEAYKIEHAKTVPYKEVK